MHLIWIDYAIIGIIGLSILISLVRGFVREALSLVTWAAAIWVAFIFGNRLSQELVDLISSPTFRQLTSYGSLFLITLLLGALVNFLIAQLIEKTGLSGTDRVLGTIFGGARGLLIVTVLLMLAKLTAIPEETVWKKSLLIPHFQGLENILREQLPETIAEHFQINEIKTPYK